MQRYKKYLTNIAIAWMVFFTLVFFAYFIFLRPHLNIRRQLESELIEKKQIYADAKSSDKEETKKRMNAELDELGKKLGGFVIDSEVCGNLIFDISQIASEKRVSTFSIKTRNSGEIQEIPKCLYVGESLVDISFVSGFNQFASLLSDLERNRPVVFIKNFSISRNEKNIMENEVNLGVSLLVKKHQDS